MDSTTCRLPPPRAGTRAHQSLCIRMHGHGRNAMAQPPRKDKQGCNATSGVWTGGQDMPQRLDWLGKAWLPRSIAGGVWLKQ